MEIRKIFWYWGGKTGRVVNDHGKFDKKGSVTRRKSNTLNDCIGDQYEQGVHIGVTGMRLWGKDLRAGCRRSSSGGAARVSAG